ncbi:hypothetical protein DE146DRAFT_450156, partial [Phaeosphaeria sp. MPI-PUGE-AT-0046c]
SVLSPHASPLVANPVRARDPSKPNEHLASLDFLGTPKHLPILTKTLLIVNAPGLSIVTPNLQILSNTPQIGTMAQTPQQRQANMRFAKAQEKKMGRPEQIVKKQGPQKSPISKIWIILLGFVLCGGLVFELLKMFF